MISSNKTNEPTIIRFSSKIVSGYLKPRTLKQAGLLELDEAGVAQAIELEDVGQG